LKIDLKQILENNYNYTNIQSANNLTFKSIFNTLIFNKIISNDFKFDFIPKNKLKNAVIYYRTEEENIKIGTFDYIKSISNSNINVTFLKDFINKSLNELSLDIKEIDISQDIDPRYIKEIVISMESA
jgi:hypothetical protein